jgi:hypothetical protein
MNIGWSTQHRSDRKSAVGQELTLGKDRFWRKADIGKNANVSKVPNSEHVLVGKDVSCTG